MQALSIQVDEGVSIDPKRIACQFLQQNRCGRHLFDTLETGIAASSGKMHCQLHGAELGGTGCNFFFEDINVNGSKRTGVPADVCCIGFPCAPYSFQRAGRFLNDQSARVKR